MRLITSETKDQLNWVPNQNNSQGERERERERKRKTDERENEKKDERKEWKEVSGNVVPSVDANSIYRNGA
jgi:hypothetical protein